MTFTPADPDPFDPSPLSDEELVVDAIVEGTATAEERARVDGDPALRERVAELEELRIRLSDPIEPLPTDEVDEMIRVALDASPAEQPEDGRATAGRTDTRSRPDRTRWLVAAAVLLVLALAAVTLPRLTSDRGSSGDTAASSSGPIDTAAVAPGVGADVESGASPDSGRELFAGSSFSDLGDVSTIGELIDRAVTELDRPADPSAAPSPGAGVGSEIAVGPCLDQLALETGSGVIARGSVAGVEHLVVVASPTGDPGTRSVSVVRIPDCTIVERSAR